MASKEILWKIAEKISELQKKAMEADPATVEKVDWEELESDWFDYLEERLLQSG